MTLNCKMVLLSQILSLVLYTVPMCLVFVYAFFLICNIDYPEEKDDHKDGDTICPQCHNRKQSKRWNDYARIGQFMMTQDMPKKAVFYPRRLSQKLRRMSSRNSSSKRNSIAGC